MVVIRGLLSEVIFKIQACDASLRFSRVPLLKLFRTARQEARLQCLALYTKYNKTTLLDRHTSFFPVPDTHIVKILELRSVTCPTILAAGGSPNEATASASRQ